MNNFNATVFGMFVVVMIAVISAGIASYVFETRQLDKVINLARTAQNNVTTLEDAFMKSAQGFVNTHENFEATGYEVRKLKDGRVEITFFKPAHENKTADIEKGSPINKDDPTSPQWVFTRKVTLPAWMWTEAVCKATLDLNFEKGETSASDDKEGGH